MGRPRFVVRARVRGLDEFRRRPYARSSPVGKPSTKACPPPRRGRWPCRAVRILVPALGWCPCSGGDPVTGRGRDRFVIAAVPVGPPPDQLVSGEVDGRAYTLTGARQGSIESSGVDPRRWDPVRGRRQLAEARRGRGRRTAERGVANVDDDFVMLQILPRITAHWKRRLCGRPVSGPGPVAERSRTRLAPLELDLWVEPMRGTLSRSCFASLRRGRRRRIARPDHRPTSTSRGPADHALARQIDRARPASFPALPHRSKAPVRRLKVAWRVGRFCAPRSPPGTRSLSESRRDAGRRPRIS